ncbi:MAG: FAD-dependent oxidoreductase, partial [Planctomycetota bacterium]
MRRTPREPTPSAAPIRRPGPRIGRRRFLRWLAACAGAAALPWPLSSCGGGGDETPSVPRNRDLAVVGGGIAGLYAAWRLAHAGNRVTLLEAHDAASRTGFRRVLGGRIATTTAAFDPALVYEAGAEFVFGSDEDLIETLFALSSETGIDVRPVPVTGEDLLYLDPASVAGSGGRFRWAGGLRESADAGLFDGHLHPDAVADLASGGRLETRLGRLYAEIEEPIWDTDPRRVTLGGVTIDDMTLFDVLTHPEIDLHPDAIVAIEAWFEDENGVSIRDVSGLYGTDELYYIMYDRSWSRSPGTGPRGLDPIGFYRVPGGNDRLVLAFEQALATAGVTLRTGERVTHLRQPPSGGVELTTSAGSTVFVDGAVLTAPPPALRAMAFDPPLPAAHARYVAETVYTSYIKVALHFDDRPWERFPDSQGGVFVTSDRMPGSVAAIPTAQPGNRNAALLALLSGRDAAAFEALRQGATSGAQLDAALARLRTDIDAIWPGILSDPSYRSGEDRVMPWIGTALPYPRPGGNGQSGDVYRLLPAPITAAGSVVFAGDGV